MESELKCLMEQYVLLQRLRDDLVKLRVELKSAEERHRYYLKVGNMRLARLASNAIKALLTEIRKTEREMERLESVYSQLGCS